MKLLDFVCGIVLAFKVRSQVGPEGPIIILEEDRRERTISRICVGKERKRTGNLRGTRRASPDAGQLHIHVPGRQGRPTGPQGMAGFL
jgi:hypothetical protein